MEEGVEEEVDEVEGAASLAEVVLQESPAAPPPVAAPPAVAPLRVDCQADLQVQCAQRPLPEVQVGRVPALWCWL